MATNTLVMYINTASNSPIVLGSTSSFNVNVQNISTTNKQYNLSFSLTLPDGLTLSTATLPQTSSVTNADNSITYSWINIKDLAPMEVDYTFSITIKSNTTFKNGTVIPFNYSFNNINLTASMDTMPRGSYDIGNEVFTAMKLLSFLTVAYNGTVTTLSKVLKGAGTSISLNDASHIYTSTVQIYNNTYSTSNVSISILLDDGIRYLANLILSGTDASQFTMPVVNKVLINGIYYTEIFFGGITLSKASVTTIKFNYAVWNKYNDNTGDIIYHGTKLNMYIRMGTSSSSYSINNSFSFSAMDLIITNSMNYSLIDIGYSIIYTYIFTVGQYYNLSNVSATYFIPDGINYVSSSYTPTLVVDNLSNNGCIITYNFPNKSTNSSTTVNINATVNAYYKYKFDSLSTQLPVVAFDKFTSTASVYGNAYAIPLNVSDNANVSCNINIGTVKKQFINGYYRDGSLKTISTLAPNDLAQYNLTYNASTLNAMQKQIYLNDFFPLSANPIDNLTYVYGGYNPILAPNLISPHGVNFYYGDIPGKSTASINFKVPISSLGTPPQNINLFKLSGINTAGYSYSARDQVTINVGTPNLTLTKSVSGPNKSAIQSLEIYTYTVTINNTNTLGTETDAFSFTLIDALSSRATLNTDSVSIIGTGSYSSFNYTNSNINVQITKLQPGSYITLTYSVTLKNNIPPGLTITTTATNTNPYSQLYDASLSNFQYSNLIKTASTTLSSKAITLVKTNNSAVFKVGSTILYTMTLIIPVGTIVYNSAIKDILPAGQGYIGPAYRNGSLITPTVSSNVITFPTETIIDARTSSQTITYALYCKINDAIKVPPNYTTLQTNTCQCSYRQLSSTGTLITITKTLAVTVNHPNIILNLSATDSTTLISSSSNLSINTNSKIAFNLSLKNNSNIALINGRVEIPINSNYTFYSIDNFALCTAYYDSSLSKIIITVPNLPSNTFGQLSFTLIPKSNLNSGTAITTTATAMYYYNDITTSKIYGGEISNMITCILQVSLSLLPDPATKINDSTSYIITSPGNTATITNYFTNTGGGIDSFNLSIGKALLDYSLYIDEVKIADIPKNTAYSANLDVMKNLPTGTQKAIKIITFIPTNSPLGSRYDFIVTTTSLTSPYPTKSVLNIDPN